MTNDQKPPLPPKNNHISISGDVRDSTAIIGDNNTIIQKLFNIFKSDAGFLDHCVDLIFLRRVGGGYIFIHRLLMEHFAEMYVETPTSKGN